MLKGHFRKGNKAVFDIGSRSFTISEELRRRLKIRNVLLAFFTVIFSFLYFKAGEKYQDILLKEAGGKVILEGISLSFMFLLALLLMFLTVSAFLIPKNLQEHLTEYEESFY
ncbi:hypothetical protein [Proteiniclasticum ruminis]|uniref:Uncharacterized protein n=1 Tax=Proteiniclasticum ruminis TaxID=398199 RepID=A0A1I5DUY5_9CLOT|nr:hypothetical protein [Proteiniclasticum ruminis]SFO02910.1 hypothetical protein SAMN04488695_11126 [Proteiniclasticum ruminis]